MDNTQLIKSINALRKQLIESQRSAMLASDDLESKAFASIADTESNINTHNTAIASEEIEKAANYIQEAMNCTRRAKTAIGGRDTMLEQKTETEYSARRRIARQKIYAE